jgi:hypothetical protein
MAKNNRLAPTQPISHMVSPPAKRPIETYTPYLDRSPNQVFGHFWRSDVIFPIQTVDA